MKACNLASPMTAIFLLSGCMGSRPSYDRHPVSDYPRTDGAIETTIEDPNDKLSTVIIHFSTSDSPETVAHFYEEALRTDGWDVESGDDIRPLSGLQPLPTLGTPDSLLVHGYDIRGCPLHYVDVVIDPLEASGSIVTIIVGSSYCY
jgi:hypothetical protein